MNKKEFLKRMEKKLSRLSKEERKERLAFYSEMIDDRMEEGLTEEAAVASIDPSEDIPEENEPPKRKLTAGQITLLCLGAPFWFPLLVAAFAVIFSLYVSLWSVVVFLWAAFVSLVASGGAGLIGGIGAAVSGHVPAGLAMAGMGLVCGGIAIVCFYGCHWATKGMVLLTKKLPGRLFGRRKA